MAKPAQAAGALFGTITNTAEMISNSVNTINGAVSIGNGFVQRHRVMQEDKTKSELLIHKNVLLKDTVDQIATHNETIKLKLKDPSYAASFEAAFAEVNAVFNPETA